MAIETNASGNDNKVREGVQENTSNTINLARAARDAHKYIQCIGIFNASLPTHPSFTTMENNHLNNHIVEIGTVQGSALYVSK